MKITSNTCPENIPRTIEEFFPIACTSGRLCAKKHERIALVDLNLLCEKEAELLLTGEEQDYFQKFHHPKRRREWLGGRIAAKTALSEAAQFQQVSILPDHHGRPVVSGLADNNLCLSITHSGSYAAALVAQGTRCGLDLQKISGKLLSLTDYFASSYELKLLTKQSELSNQETALTLLWTVKEAIKKSVLSNQQGIFSAIQAHQIVSLGERIWRFDCTVQNCTSQTAIVFDFSPYILALTHQVA